MYLADYLREWLDRRTNLESNTRRSYQLHIERYLVPYLGHLRLEGLGAQDIEQAYAAWGNPARPTLIPSPGSSMMPTMLETALRQRRPNTIGELGH